MKTEANSRKKDGRTLALKQVGWMALQRFGYFVPAFLVTMQISLASANETVEMSDALLRIIETIDAPAATTGLLTHSPPTEGSLVKKGQIISRVDFQKSKMEAERAGVHLELANKKASNDVDIRYAVKAHAVAVANLQRSLEINARLANSVAQKELDRLKLVVDRAELEIEQARDKQELAFLETKLKQTESSIAKHEVDRSIIRSPIDGFVLQVDKHLGEWVTAGEAVVRIVRIDRLRAEGFLQSKDVLNPLRGNKAEVRVAIPNGPTKTVVGQIVFVSPIADAVNGQVSVWVDFDNPKGALRPGLRADVTISKDEKYRPKPERKTLADRPTSPAVQTARASNGTIANGPSSPQYVGSRVD